MTINDKATRPQLRATLETTIVSLTLIPFYRPESFVYAQENWSSFEASGVSYEDYLNEARELIGDELDRRGHALVALVRAEDVDTWAGNAGLDADDPDTRLSYFSSVGSGGALSITSLTTLELLLEADALSYLRLQVLAQATGDDVIALGERVEDSDDLSEEIYEQLGEFLEEVTVTTCAISFFASAKVDGTEVSSHGEILITREDEGVGAATREEDELLWEVIGLGTVGQVALMIRRIDADKGRSTLYGYSIGPTGLAGMSEAEIFDTSCTDEDGGPIPPEDGVTYCGTTTPL
jgi:hypothetical protein